MKLLSLVAAASLFASSFAFADSAELQQCLKSAQREYDSTASSLNFQATKASMFCPRSPEFAFEECMAETFRIQAPVWEKIRQDLNLRTAECHKKFPN